MVENVFLILCLMINFAASTRVNYDNYSVIRCFAESQNQLEYLNQIQSNNDLKLDFWTESRNIQFPIDMMVQS